MDDLISRQAAIEALAEVARDRFNLQDAFQECLDALNDAESKIKRLPSAQPERNNGKWLYTDAYPHWMYCDRCHKRIVPNKEWIELYNIPTNYCPNCGASMEASDD